MFRRRRPHYHRHRSQGILQSSSKFLRKPAVQLTILVISFGIVVFLALSGQTPGIFSSGSPTPTPPLSLSPATYPATISQADAHELYGNDQAYFLDVRERTEWDQVHIPTSTLLPLGQLPAFVDKFPKDKLIVIISAADDRAKNARELLFQAGVTNVTSLVGGINGWRENGYPTEP